MCRVATCPNISKPAYHGRCIVGVVVSFAKKEALSINLSGRGGGREIMIIMQKEEGKAEENKRERGGGVFVKRGNSSDYTKYRI